MNQFVLQELQQIRTIVQQIAQAERQNAQQLAYQPGLQHIAQKETTTAQQLEHVVGLVTRVEQSIWQTTPTVSSQFIPQTYTQPAFGIPQGSVNPAVYNQVMGSVPATSFAPQPQWT